MSAQHHGDQVTIVVVRSGGFAGLRREWRVDAGDDDVDRWLVLVEACPWDEPEAASRREDGGSGDAAADSDTGQRGDAGQGRDADPRRAPERKGSAPEHPRPEPTPEPGPSPRAADRYVWIIRARTPEHRRETELPEPALTGPWRELVDAVRSVN